MRNMNSYIKNIAHPLKNMKQLNASYSEVLRTNVCSIFLLEEKGESQYIYIYILI